MYREIREAQRSMGAALEQLRRAITADTTREMGESAGAVQAGIVFAKQRLDGSNDDGDGAGPKVERRYVSTAITALDRAFSHAEHVAMATNPAEMRAYLVDLKTYVDYADAYLRVALGMEDVSSVIVHIVLGTPSAGISQSDRNSIDNGFADLRTIPGVENVTWGPDVSGRGRGYTFGAVLHISDRGALRDYATHPVHLELVTLLNRLMPERLVIDYETTNSGMSD